MKPKLILKAYNKAFIISAILSLSIYSVLKLSTLNIFSPYVMQNLPEIILGISVFVVACKQLFIFRPVARSVRLRNEELKKARQEAEEIAQFPINNPHPLMKISCKGDILFANPAAYEHYPALKEYGLDHPIMQNLEEFIDQVHIEPNKKHMKVREITYGGFVYQQTITSVLSKGELALVVYCYDITAIKKAQNEARLLGAVVEEASDGVIITKADITNPEIIYVNDAVTRITGYETHELIGQTPKMLQGSATNRKTLDELREALSQGRAFKGELQNYTKKGMLYWLDISIVPVKDEKGRITHFAAIERDITQRKAFEKELQINREAAEVANRAKGDFLANMSHELRTPMNGIIGLSELLMEMDMGADQFELAEAVNSSSRNLLILLNDILDLSKIEAGELTLENIPFDTRRAVRQTVDLLRPIASRKGVILDSAINPIVPDRLMGDPARLQQIMNNLISNAIKFTDVGYVRIDVTSARDGAGDPELHIRVEDTGIGIAEDKREMVFQKFTQADVSTARKYGGTGLGLSITKELVEMMGGTISFDSAEGRGTTFYVEIPLEAAAKEEIVKDGNGFKMAIPIDTKSKVMVVDDHPVNLLFMRKVLKKLGFDKVDEAVCGREAVELAEKTKYDLIFMDCQMPEIDGFEASTIIREREELIGDIKIIAVTADAMKGAREKCLDAGMNGYISKPVDIEKLKSILGEWLPGDAASQSQVFDIVEELGAEAKDEEASMVMDWDRLRMFTDGSPEEERALIEMFSTYAEESLGILKICQDGADEEWKKAAHKLKGSAANLGAQILSEMCFEAELGFEKSEQEKEEILAKILSSYEQVCEHLDREVVQA